jgi:hypothetical protein
MGSDSALEMFHICSTFPKMSSWWSTIVVGPAIPRTLGCIEWTGSSFVHPYRWHR